MDKLSERVLFPKTSQVRHITRGSVIRRAVGISAICNALSERGAAMRSS
jgi:hypothetical protein